MILTVWALALAVLPMRAQDVGLLQERVKQLTGKVENLEEDNNGLKKQMEGLMREIQSLREQVQNQSKAVPATSASQDDLRELAKKIQEVDEKRKADYELIAKEIKALGRVAAGGAGGGRTRPSPRDSGAGDKPAADLPKEAIEHTIASGDTLLAIALAYSKETGKKVTTDMILQANDGLKAEKLVVGKKILIPIPAK